MEVKQVKLGVIGAGNMGSAIIRGYIAGGAEPQSVTVCGHHPDKLNKLSQELGITLVDSPSELTKACDVILLAVKPKDVAEVLSSADQAFTPEKILVSIAAGKTIDILSSYCPSARKIIRVMPNTPARVGSGMSVLSRNKEVTDEDYRVVESVFNGIGLAEEVPESLMDAVTGLSGSGPAFVYLFIEALADGGVLCGLPREKAISLAAQTVYGSARMVLETQTHPASLKDAVCSPGGTTIEGVRKLEAGAFRSTVIEAVAAACEKSKRL